MPKGVGLPLLRRLSSELGLTAANLHSARGFSGVDSRGVFNRVEKDVLTVVVSEEQSEDVFLWIYREAEVSTQRGRFIHQARLRGATPFHLPEGVPQEPA